MKKTRKLKPGDIFLISDKKKLFLGTRSFNDKLTDTPMLQVFILEGTEIWSFAVNAVGAFYNGLRPLNE